ncbi:hypothetical protein KAR91_72765 [Candidatus Pacearchaeota archaeon]|nr:hypothetical protein [Candidatus Pacearchaeota archaeon]
MELIHTSPEAIETGTITDGGMFGECLCFSANEYVMTVAPTVYVYSLDIAESDIINVSQLHDDDIVSDIARVLLIDDDDAERVLDGRDTAFDFGGEGEDDWWVQGKQGECAKKMGYRAARGEDEQGAVYIVPMTGREGDLTLERMDDFR